MLLRPVVSTPADFEIPYEDLELTTRDGVKIKAYLMIPKQKVPEDDEVVSPVDDGTQTKLDDNEFAASRPTVLFFHANAGNIGHRIPLARIFFRNIGCNVLMISYRGYGHSEGSPSEKGIKLDSQAALDYVLAHPILSRTNLIFYGQSIGGAVAIDLAARNPGRVTALILENTFTSIPAMARKIMPMVRPFLWLCTENWNSLRAIKLVLPSTHILLLSGLRDELVPPSQMKQLWEIITEKGMDRRVWHDFANGTHNDTCVQPGYWARVKEFVDSI